MSASTPEPPAHGEDTRHQRIMAAAGELIALGVCSRREARDPVNQATINTWTDALGDANPRWHSGVAPPAMAQVWTMYALGEPKAEDDPLHSMMAVLSAEGFTGVLGTNCEQSYGRPLKLGETPRLEMSLESVVGPKETGMGPGYFVTARTEWFVGPIHEPERVAAMLFRVLKFVPKPRVKPDTFVLYPTMNRDTVFFWEGTAAGELRIQTCNACGALRHPPGPSCPHCHAFDRGYVVSAGRGTVFSHVTHHHPKIPGHSLPMKVALVDLDEGVRMLAGSAADLAIGDRVRVAYRRIDDDLTLPMWEKVGAEDNDVQPQVEGKSVATPNAGLGVAVTPDSLPEWSLDITPTFVVCSALATRDYQDVHHDKARAIELGSADIFVNILTSQGLVQRYVTDSLGANVDIRSIGIRLGAPAYPGDTLTMTGSIIEETEDARTLAITGSVSLGAHIRGTVVLNWGGRRAVG